jgi:flavorubredoxin
MFHKPAITVLTYKPNENILKELLAGIEEEGVNFEVQADDNESDAALLSEKASKLSKLEVGIAVTNNQTYVHVRNLAAGKYLFKIESEDNARRVGYNAARYVKGTPFVQVENHY